MNGILLLDKPAGWTSMDVCAKLRGALRERRIGHSGTLDPMATGLLVVFLGRATRAAAFAEADRKTYLASLRTGLVTDTQDTSGAVLSARAVSVTDAELDAALARFRGDIEQIPPMYSAVKVGGKKLYQLARKGRTVARAPRPVTIYALERLGRAADGDFRLLVEMQQGDLHPHALPRHRRRPRLRRGDERAAAHARRRFFSIEDAHPLDAVLDAAAAGRAEELLLPVDALFAEAPALTLTAAQEAALKHGVRYSCPLPETTYRLYGADGSFLALGAPTEGKMRIVRTFFEVQEK